jgi:hypothetical protein
MHSRYHARRLCGAFASLVTGSTVASELRSKEEAYKTYEDGIAQGSLPSVATTYGDGITNLSSDKI